MAQAPQSNPTPRMNRTVKQFNGMNTQNRRNAIPEGSFAWLENIQPIGPGNLHSIPGRSSQVVLIPPFIPPINPCVPIAPPGGLSLVDLLFETGVDASNRWTWSFIDDNTGGELVYMAATNSPFPVNQQLYLSTNGTTSTETFPTGIISVSNLAPGNADRTLFGNASGGFFTLFTLDNDSDISINLGGHGFTGSNVRNWSVGGDLLFLGGDDLLSNGHPIVAKFIVSTQTFVSFIETPADTVSLQTIHYDGEFVYVLTNSSTPNYTLRKYDTDLVFVEEFDLIPTIANEPYMAVFSDGDDHVYYIKRRFNATPVAVAIGYIDNMNAQVVLDESVPDDTLPVSQAAAVMVVHTDPDTNERFVYLGSQLSAQIYKYGPIICAS